MAKSKGQRRLNKGSLTPATPRGSTPNATDTSTSAQDLQLLISPFATPPTSPSSPSFDLPPPMTPQFSTVEQISLLEPTISADNIISKDIVEIADMFAMMKKAMLMMTSAFDRFEIQTEKFASLSLDIKAAEQVCPYRIVICRLILHYIILSSWVKCAKPWTIKSRDRKLRLRI